MDLFINLRYTPTTIITLLFTQTLRKINTTQRRACTKHYFFPETKKKSTPNTTKLNSVKF